MRKEDITKLICEGIGTQASTSSVGGLPKGFSFTVSTSVNELG